MAAFIPGSEQDTNITDSQSIQIHFRGGPLQYISDCHKSYKNAFHFVLFHPEGQDGWSPASIELVQPSQPESDAHANHQGNEEEDPRAVNNNEYFEDEPMEEHVKHSNECALIEQTRRVQRKYITPREYAAFIMHNRTPESNALMVYGKRLYQEYLCDKYATIEGQRLSWFL